MELVSVHRDTSAPPSTSNGPRLHLRDSQAASMPDDTEPDSNAEHSKHSTSSSVDAGLGLYTSYLQMLGKVWADQPDLSISFQDVAFRVPIAQQDLETPTIGRSIKGVFNRSKPDVRVLDALQPATGVIKPGTSTLVLAPPGHGRSTLLKALAGRLHGDKRLSGTVTYNGATKDQLGQLGWSLDKLAVLIEQKDFHFAHLTVEETLKFAYESTLADTSLLGNEELTELHASKVDMIIKLLGLDECRNTVVGNDLLRGVSGGQRKRVSIGELLMTNARALLLDDVTMGLDSAVAYHICDAIVQWSRLTRGSAVAVLNQPTPEIFELFDNVILMRRGAVVFHGPREQLRPFVTSLGFRCPDDTDLADFVVSVLTDPDLMLVREQRRNSMSVSLRGAPSRGDVPVLEGQLGGVGKQPSFKGPQSYKGLATTTNAMLSHFNASELRTQLDADVAEAVSLKLAPITEASAFTSAQFGTGSTRAYGTHVKLNLKRQVLLTLRDKTMVVPRIAQAIIMSLVIGTMFWQLDPSAFVDRLGLVLFACLIPTFANFAEMPIAYLSKSVLYKQLQSGFFPASSYTLGVLLMHFFVAVTEITVFSAIVYFTSNFTAEATRFLFFICACVAQSMGISVLVRAATYLVPDEDAARQMLMPYVAISLIFGGYLITFDKIPAALEFVYWITPFSWTIRSLALNEFGAGRYDTLLMNASGEMQRAGDLYMDSMGFNPDQTFYWPGVAFNLGQFVLLGVVSNWAIRAGLHDLTVGTSRAGEEEEVDAAEAEGSAVLVDVDPTAKRRTRGRNSFVSAQKQPIPFTPMTLSFSALEYTVPIKGDPAGKRLLDGVSGFAKPGTMTALMGASGAGKTTLMDVLALRKTAGTIAGTVMVNGQPQDKKTFSRVMGYVEQENLHMPLATVLESLQFAAKLRLPTSVSNEQRAQHVATIMKLLELEPIASRVIQRLSPAQQKLVTMGVELCANPTFLFCDEPTSGLDARSALHVMKGIANIASSGRSVVCTIHQPSTEVFLFFDHLLLLRPGGQQVFFGDIGEHASELVQYLEAQGAQPCPDSTNPATWMLDVVAPAGRPLSEVTDYATLYAQSALKQTNTDEIAEAAKPETYAKLAHHQIVSRSELPGIPAQMQLVFGRSLRSHWRNPALNLTRFGLSIFLGLLFGTVYFQVDDSDFTGIRSKISVMFLSGSFIGFIMSTTGAPGFFAERAVYYREQSSQTYRGWVYRYSMLVADIPYTAIALVLFVVPSYFMIGMQEDLSLFVQYYFAVFMLASVFINLGHAMAAALPNVVVGQAVESLLFNFFFLFGGLYRAAADIPQGWYWFYIINPIPKGLAALVGPQFDGNTNIITIANEPTTVEAYVRFFLNTSEGFWMQILYLFLIILALRVLVEVFARNIYHAKR